MPVSEVKKGRVRFMMSSDELFRLERDSIGEKQVPKDAYYGVQTLRGKENFDITGEALHPEMVRALAIVKKACAQVNHEAGLMHKHKATAIAQACDDILQGKLPDQFITDPIQGGAGTTANMNANEVIANRANEILDGELGTYDIVRPNDDVNMGQSTNDVYPTAGKLGAIYLLRKTLEELELLVHSFATKGAEFDDVVKMARTQLEDAVPIRLGQEFNAYASAIRRGMQNLEMVAAGLTSINMGGSAVGTGINVDRYYFDHIVPRISRLSGVHFEQADDLIDATQNVDVLVLVSAAVKTLAVSMSKISSDLRLMSSGPKTMVGDINLPARQNGSSIMPGKVNPVIPEVVNQVAFRIIGNDLTVTMAAEGGQMELNAFEPVLFYSLYQSIEMLGNAAHTLRVHCVDGITANAEKLRKDLRRSVGVITAFVPHIGYEKAARIANEALASGKALTDLILAEGLLSESDIAEILDPWAMTEPGIAAGHLIRKVEETGETM